MIMGQGALILCFHPPTSRCEVQPTGIAVAFIVDAPRASCGCDERDKMLETGATLENGVQQSAVAASAPVGYAQRSLDVLVHQREPAGEWMSSRLRTGLLILILLEAANLLEVRTWGSTYFATASYFCSFESLLAITVFSASFFGKFERHWRGSTMALCLAVILSHTLLAIAMDENEQALVALFVIVTSTALLVPWGMRWQCALTVAGFVCFIIMSLTGTVEHEDLQLWVILGVTMAFALCFTVLKHNYVLQSEMVESLRQSRDFGSEHVEKMTAMQTRLVDEHEQASRLATIVNASDDAILGFSQELKITTWNPAAERIYGYTAEEAIGHGQSLFVPPDELQSAIEICLQVLKTGEPMSFEQRGQRKDNTWFVSQVSVFPIRGLDGEIMGMAGIGRDITQLKEAERELVVAREVALAASRAKSEFLSSMSHEIRTPMNAILGMAQLLEETPLNSDQKRYLEIMTNNGDALLELINGILDLARIESGQLALEQAGFHLESIVDGAVETLALRAHQKGLEILAHVMPDVPTGLVGDQLRLRQILINLVGNAIKFTAKGQVLLTVEREGESADPGNLHFSVADTGIGIAKDKLEDVFSSFTQADSSTTRQFGGSGLGLAIVRRLVALMGGRVWVESDLGHGSIFHFTAHFQVQTDAAVERDATVAIMLSGVRVLVVDDNFANRLILREMLSSRGAEVDEAEDGPSALEQIERAKASGVPYKLMLLDCRMPGMDGFQVAERVKAGPEQDLTLLMLSSDNLKVQLSRAHELGLDAYLVKPVRRTELFETIGTAMANHRVRLEHQETEPEQPPVIAAIQGVVPNTPAATNLNILLADDSKDNRLLIHAFLKDTGYLVEDAENGAIAVAKLKVGNYDLVLMDIQMPVMDGLEATRAIRAWEQAGGRSRKPILALTASAVDDDVRRTLEAGVDMHISKPIKKASLIAAIKSSTSSPCVLTIAKKRNDAAA
jgi:two-component system sensor histidine kinase/response regulator